MIQTTGKRDPAKVAANLVAAQKAQAIADNLLSWQTVSNMIDAATTVAKLQAVVKKMARVEYWLARGTLE